MAIGHAERYRRDPAAFAREVMGIDLFPFQVEAIRALENGHRVTSARRANQDTIRKVLHERLRLLYFIRGRECRVNDTFKKCPVCGSEILAKQTMFMDKVEIFTDGTGLASANEYVDYNDEIIYCQNGHTHEEMLKYRCQNR